MKVLIKNPKTGELKSVKIGWSWTLFLFSSVFGIPLFLRKLYVLGTIMVLWRFFVIFANAVDPSDQHPSTAGVIALLTEIVIVVWLGVKGNEYTAKNYLERGWVFARPDSLEAQYAMSRWNIELPAAQPALSS